VNGSRSKRIVTDVPLPAPERRFGLPILFEVPQACVHHLFNPEQLGLLLGETGIDDPLQAGIERAAPGSVLTVCCRLAIPCDDEAATSEHVCLWIA
jgi:hypothetical protein